MRIYHRGEKWGIDWYDGFKRRRQLVGPSKGEAKSLLAAKRTERLRGRREIVPKAEAPAFDQYVEGPYTEYARTNKRGFYNERYRLKQLTGYFGKINISDLRRSHAERFKSEMSYHLAPGTFQILADPFADRRRRVFPELAGEILGNQDDRALLIEVRPGKVAAGDQGVAHGLQ